MNANSSAVAINRQESEVELDRKPSLDISNPQVRFEYSLSAILGFNAIMKAWAVQDEDARKLIGNIPPESYEEIKSGKCAEALSEDQMIRVSVSVRSEP